MRALPCHMLGMVPGLTLDPPPLPRGNFHIVFCHLLDSRPCLHAPECMSADACHCRLYRFLHGDDDERSSLFKMIPRIAEGSWVVRQSVGTTPVIVGRKLTTSYFITPKYVEVAVDVGSSSTAQYVTGMVSGGFRGGAR